MPNKKEISNEDKKTHCVNVNSTSLPISIKQSVEIANYIRNKPVQRVKILLKNVLQKKIAVPFKRYNRDMGHKPGKISSGRYPEKAIKYFLILINSLEANAENKGLNVEKLVLSKVVANKGPNQWHSGRMRRRKMKRTHLSLMATEV